MTSRKPIVITLSDTDEVINLSDTDEVPTPCRTEIAPDAMLKKDTKWFAAGNTEDKSRMENLDSGVAVQSSRKRKRHSRKINKLRRKKRRRDLTSMNTMIDDIKLHLISGQTLPIDKSNPSNSNATNEQKCKRIGKRERKRKKARKEDWKRNKVEVPMTEISGPSRSEDMEMSIDPRMPKKWTEEMRKFYFDTVPGAANLNLEEVLAKMSDDANSWRVGKIDRRRKLSYYYDHNFTCKNCNRIGHLTQYCKELSKRDKHRLRNICWICSAPGHHPDQCSYRICFRCGNQRTMEFTDNCYLCNMIDMSKVQCERCCMWGHISDNCTDNWRMYNFTVKPGKIIRATAYEKPSSRLCCCNCAQWGHVSEDCKKPKMSAYYNVSSSVVNYDYNVQSQLANCLRQAQERFVS